MNKKKLTSLFLSVMMVVSLFSATLASAESAESKFADLYGHWAKAEVEAWAEQGLVEGYSDGTFKPNNSISRAELMTLVNNGFGFINKSDVNFADVNGSEWYVKEIALAVEAGYIQGYEADNTVQPKGEITRQEMAMVISRLLELDANAAATADFSDAVSFPNWSKGAIGAVAAAGYMKGYEDKSFAPTKSITRAEAVATLSRLGNYITAAGTYDDLGTVSGNLIVTTSDVIVKGATVNGDLIVTEGVGEGDATFEDVTVKGNTRIHGGGVNTVFFINSTLAGLDVDKKNTPVRVVISGTTTTGAVNLAGAATLGTSDLAEDAGFGSIVISEPGNYVLNGNFDEVVIASEGVNVEIAEDAEVANLVIDAPATVTGEGTIKKATVNASDATIEQKPEEIEVAEDVTVTIADEELTADDVANYNNSNNTGGAVGGGGGYYIPPAETSIEVSNEAELRAALANNTNKRIYLKQGIEIKTSADIDGNGNILIVDSPYTSTSEAGAADALGIMADNVTIKNLTVEYNKEAEHDNLIEIYGDKATLENVTVKGSYKAGIYVLHNGTSETSELTVSFINVTTEDNKWAGVGLKVDPKVLNGSIRAEFSGFNANEPVAVYTEKEYAQYTVNGLIGYFETDEHPTKLDPTEDQTYWVITPNIENVTLVPTAEEGLRLDFSIDQDINLSEDRANIEIAYEYSVDGEIWEQIINEVAEEVESPLVKDKTWSGYLWVSEDERYSEGDLKGSYPNLVPANKVLATSIKKSNTYVPSEYFPHEDNNLLKPGHYKVTITVTHEHGGYSVKTETVKVE